MTDWRQIQARIRKAKNSPDALTKLSELFQRTRDGMVAWELGAIEEKSERTGEAVKWYTVAAERFRRAEWKKKAEEALTRLGAPIPVASDSSHQHNSDTDMSHESTEKMTESDNTEIPQVVTLPNVAAEVPQLAYGEIPPESSQDSAATVGENAGSANHNNNDPKRKRRRGRRGGRGRRRKDAAAAPSLPTQAFAESIESQPQPSMASSKPDLPAPLPFRQPEPKLVPVANSSAMERATPEPSRPSSFEVPSPQLPSQRSAHGRAGDPALASRMAHLESMLRRLLSSPLRRLDDADQAPAGPGVFLLSDSDQVTSYYVESCQTLRVGLGNLSRGGRNAKPNRSGGSGGRGYSESGLKAKLAEHLGISEAKVGQYMKDHCVVRWIQLDDEAALLAHFAIGVLRTPLNLE